MKKHIKLIYKEIELYEKLLIQNNDILLALNASDLETIEKKIENKEKLLIEIKKIDDVLTLLWENWERYKDLFTEKEKEPIRNLRKLIGDNLKIEDNIISQMKERLKTNKAKKKEIAHGKKVLNAYQGIKSNISRFINQKS
jgi:predicted XRE-type DNA-binding protein